MSRASARTFHGTTLALAPITHGDKFIMPYKVTVQVFFPPAQEPPAATAFFH